MAKKIITPPLIKRVGGITKRVPTGASSTTTNAETTKRKQQILDAFNYNIDALVGFDQTDQLNQMLSQSETRAVTRTDSKNEVSNVSTFDIAPIDSSQIYPGKLVVIDKTKFLDHGPQDFSVGKDQRNPFSIKMEVARKTSEKYISDANNADTVVNKAVEELVQNAFKANNGNPLSISANVAMNGEEIYSSEHLDTKITCKASAIKLDTSVSYSSDKKENHILYKITQIYYTADIDSSNIDATSMFNLNKVDDVLINKLNACKKNATPLAYVSRVCYGKVAVILLSSTQSTEEMKAAMNVSSSVVNVSSDMNSKKEYKNIKVKVAVFGGNMNEATQLCSSTLDDFVKAGYKDKLNAILADNTFSKPSEAVPILYQMKYLKDNSDVAVTNTFGRIDYAKNIKILFKANHLGVVVNTYTRYMFPRVKNGELVWQAEKDGNKRQLSAWDSESLTVPAKARFIQFSISPQVRGRKYTMILDSLPLTEDMLNDNGEYEFKVTIQGDTGQDISFNEDVNSIEFNQDYSLYEDKKYDGVFRKGYTYSKLNASENGFYNTENYVAYLANKDFQNYENKVDGLYPFVENLNLIKKQDQQEKAKAESKK